VSKASEWCINHNNSENLRPELRLSYHKECGREVEDRPVISVTDHGLALLRTAIIDADQALQLRDWLTDTFEDK